MWAGGEEAYDELNLADDASVFAAISHYLLPHSKGNDCVDLGAGRGTMSVLLEARTVVSVDPYPPAHTLVDIVACDGVEYLKSQADGSIDLVFAVFAVHYMDRMSLDLELTRVLRPDGRAIWFSISGLTLATLGEELGLAGHGAVTDFCDLFLSKGFDHGHRKMHPTATFKIPVPVTCEKMYKFIAHRTWTNLKLMTDAEIERLLSLIPSNLSTVTLHIDVWEYKLGKDGELIDVEPGSA